MHVASTRGPFPFSFPFPFPRPNCIRGNEKRFMCGLAFSGAQARAMAISITPVGALFLYVMRCRRVRCAFASRFENAKGATDLQIDGDCFLLLSCPLCFHM